MLPQSRAQPDSLTEDLDCLIVFAFFVILLPTPQQIVCRQLICCVSQSLTLDFFRTYSFAMKFLRLTPALWLLASCA